MRDGLQRGVKSGYFAMFFRRIAKMMIVTRGNEPQHVDPGAVLLRQAEEGGEDLLEREAGRRRTRRRGKRLSFDRVQKAQGKKSAATRKPAARKPEKKSGCGITQPPR